MIRPAVVCLAGLLAFSGVTAKTFQARVETGEAVVVQKASGQKVTVTGNTTLTYDDSLLIAGDNQVIVDIEDGCKVQCKGPLSAVLRGDDYSMVVALQEGQVLLNREKKDEYFSIEMQANGYSFKPVGTVAAVKTARNGNPTTAVISGKIQMTTPTGESTAIEKGQFGSVDANGKIVFGQLSQKAIESLEQWASQSSDVTPVQTAETTPVSAETTPPVEDSQSAGSTQPLSTQPQTAQPEASAPKTSQPPVSAAPAATGSPNATAENKAAADDANAQDTKANDVAASDEKKPDSRASAGPSAPQWEIGAGVVTVNNQQWTRLALGVDVPIWKFGVFFDVEFFIDNEGKISDKGWNFKDDWVDALTRKIRYIRFGQETDPLFIKFGGLSNVSLGYGFIVDRFTNMLHYPDQKLLGLQFNLNDISPVGVSLQTMIADFKDFKNDGGIVAARLALKPMKMTEIPIVKGISIGGTYAVDINQYAPARDWDYPLKGEKWDRDQDGITDSSFYFNDFGNDSIYSHIKDIKKKQGDFDTVIENPDQWASRATDQYGIIGGDIGIPLISTSLLSLDLYGQGGMRDDGEHGWGIGAPGVALKVWKLWASVEYRRVEGRFTPGYFGPYYFDERLVRTPRITTKEQTLVSDTLNGIFGKLGFNIANALIIDGSYQYMVGQSADNKDQRFEAIASVGDMILQKIPKLNRAEAYYYKTNIGIENDGFFEKTPSMYWGYRAGFEIAQGASLIWDSRYGYTRNADGKLVSNNSINVQTAISF